MKPNNIDLVGDLILTLLHRPCCPKLPLPCIPRYCHQRLVSSRSHLLAPSLWYLIPAMIHGKHHEFSISVKALACILAFRQDGAPGTAQKTLLETSNYAWSWYICYSIKLSCRERNSEVWPLIVSLFFKFLGMVEIFSSNNNQFSEFC